MQYTMLAFGQFAFGMDTLAYQTFERQTSWRHPTSSRVGVRPATQFLGPDADTIELSGLLVPEFAGNRMTLEELRAMGDAGGAWPLVGGDGAVFGQFVLERVREGRTIFLADGTPRRIEFSLSFKRVDDDLVDLLGSAGLDTAYSTTAFA